MREPVLGREGNSGTIFDGEGGSLAAGHRTYAARPALSRGLVEPPRIAYVDPLRGERPGYGVSMRS